MPKDALPVYNPRWLYRFFAFLERLPIRPWVLGMIVFLAVTLITHWDAWEKGVLLFGKFKFFFTSLGLFMITGFAQWHYLTLRARPAIQDFFKGSKSPTQIERMLSDFVSLPSTWGTIVFILGALLGYFGFTEFTTRFDPRTAQVVPYLGAIAAVESGALFSIVIFRVARQSRLTRRFYSEVDVNLFNPSPLYALSNYSVANIISLLLGTYVLQLFAFPSFLFSSFGIIYQIGLSAAFISFFVAQLLGVNARMRRAKQQLLGELGKDFERVYNDVHKATQKRAYATVERMQASVATLKNEQEILQKIPTWPWQPETLRNLLTPMLLPVIVYLVQRYFGGLLGF